MPPKPTTPKVLPAARERVGAGRGNDFDAARFASREVDVVQAHAQAADHAQAGGGRERMAAHLRAVAHDQRIGVGNGSRQSRAVVDQLRVVDDLESCAQGSHGRLVHELGNDNLFHR